MDAPTRAMAEYTVGLDPDAIGAPVIHALTRHVVDAVGCALGALDSRPATVARRIAATAGSRVGASVFGLAERSTPEYAAFANTAMVRYLDYNDTGIGGHPSDMIPAVLAVAEAVHASGRRVLAAIHAAYEVVAALRRGGLSPRRHHVDQVQAVLGGVVGAGFVLDLDLDRMANAIALAITPNIPMRVVRTGRLSDWKGCATAHSALMAVLAARWAEAGLTGPERPFEGIAGMYDMLGMPPLDLTGIGRPSDGRSAVESTGLKFYPAEYSAQGPLHAVLGLRAGIRVADIREIDIALHWGGWHEIGGGQGDVEEKWNPTTRESADHSLPYLVAAALLDGGITTDSFSAVRLADPALHALMQRITVREDPELTRRHAGELPRWPSVVEIRLADGRCLRREVAMPKGHPLDPLSDAEVEAKFRSLCDPVLPAGQGQKLAETLWALDELADVNILTDQFRTLPVSAADR